MSNSKLSDDTLPSLYVSLDSSRKGYCYITDRYGSSLRRGDDADAGKSSRCYENKSIWIIQRKTKPSFLLFPIGLLTAIDSQDKALYGWNEILNKIEYTSKDQQPLMGNSSDEAVTQDKSIESSIKKSGHFRWDWEQVFVDRHFKGVFLRFNLPEDDWKTHKWELKERRKIFIVAGKTGYCVDTLFRPQENCDDPEFVLQSELVADLARRVLIPDFMWKEFPAVKSPPKKMLFESLDSIPFPEELKKLFEVQKKFERLNQ